VAISDRETIRITEPQGGHVGTVSVMHDGKDDNGFPVYGYWIFDRALAIIDEGRVLRFSPRERMNNPTQALKRLLRDLVAAGDDYKKMRDGRIGDNPEFFQYEAMAWAFEHQPLLRKAIRDLRGPEIPLS
jgi:hypothetical protein